MWKFTDTRKIVQLMSSALVVVILLLLIFYDTRSTTIRVALSWINQAQFAGIYVADAKGFYRDEKIIVNLIERDFNGPVASNLLNEGKVDIAIVSSGDFLRATNDGKDIVALAAVFQTSPITIASLEKTNIRSPKDLAGKKVGLAVMTEESKLPIYALLEEEEIPKNSIIFLEVGYNQVDTLLRGDVDAISIYRTNELYELERKGIPYSLLLPERFGVDMYGDIIVVKKSYLLSHEKEVGGFLRATFKGWGFAEKNLGEATRITLEVDNPRYHDAMREEYILKKALEMVRRYPKQTMGQMIPLHWNQMYSLFQKHGLVSDIELDNFFPNAEIYRRLGFPEY